MMQSQLDRSLLHVCVHVFHKNSMHTCVLRVATVVHMYAFTDLMIFLEDKRALFSQHWLFSILSMHTVKQH